MIHFRTQMQDSLSYVIQTKENELNDKIKNSSGNGTIIRNSSFHSSPIKEISPVLEQQKDIPDIICETSKQVNGM